MFGARFAVFVVRRVRVLPSPSQATRNFSDWYGLVLNVSLNGTSTNVYAHVVVVREHV